MNARVAFEELVPTPDGFALSAWPRDAAPVQLLPALAEIFCRDAKRQQVSLTLPFEHDDDAAHAFVTRAIREGIADTVEHEGSMLRLTTSRASFWQQPSLWLTAPSSAGMPMRYTIHHNRRHPVRAPKPKGTVYRRFMPTVGMTFTLRTVDVERDTDTFHHWQNQDRVAHFWDFKGTREQHAAYLAEQCADPHVHPLIGCFDDEPFAYFEVYWAKEDRVAPFYDAGDSIAACICSSATATIRARASCARGSTASCITCFSTIHARNASSASRASITRGTLHGCTGWARSR